MCCVLGRAAFVQMSQEKAASVDREIRQMSTAHHKNIVGLKCREEDQDRLYVAMELCDVSLQVTTPLHVPSGWRGGQKGLCVQWGVRA